MKGLSALAVCLLVTGCASRGDVRNIEPTAARPGYNRGAVVSIEVTEGDSLWVLADTLWSDPTYWYSLAVMNNIRSPYTLRPGQLLRVAGKGQLLRAPILLPGTQASLKAPKATSAVKTDAEQYGWKKDSNRSFTVGERLKFAVQYGPITAGFATLQIPEYTMESGRPCMHIQAVARTHPSFEWFYKVRDVIDSYVDADYLFSWKYSKHLREGSYKQDSDYIYDQRAGREVIDDNNLRTKIAAETHDVLSCFYYFRTLELNPGDVIKIPVAADDMKFYELIVRVLRREKNVKTLAGRFDTIVVVPELKFEGVFQQKGKVTIWLSDDQRHIPVKIRSKIAIGSININLQEATWVRPPE